MSTLSLLKPKAIAHLAGWCGAFGLLLVIAIALLAPWITGSDPTAMIARPYLAPGQNVAHLLGTDTLGRDIWSGIAWGARLSLSIGLAAGLLTAVLGLVIGSFAGFYGGWVDNQLMRITELFQIMPSLLFTLVLVLILGPTVSTITLGIAATAWPNVARIARGEARRLRNLDFVLAGKVMGMRDSHILLVHILPNVLIPVVAMLAMLVGHAILTEAALAFLGMGDPNVISWGSMIGQGRDVLRSAGYISAIPGIAIFFTVASLSLLGRAINDVINPQRGRLQ
ncbi:ABC transporter permease [Pantoea cypripedii]|uniref:ABC transporter permease n=1 Tax=Pantoea cypripedii TaxID=55209 RepID=A0A6B9GEB7_PANCY|nr:ABC transporter permease [Pantoea cypripedii]QGY32607.1 ABC transporter permease [Pantoea cypripedii]